ncbi:hypothetical protein E3E12_01750 [Formicincola oecophyllae]|uniref:Uncharacterized protein n=1 Tax=Formicincola oecophyllae TaxID=2558361 RepID=A0A4Y6U998_9PROT|nr:hypothetical protein [Formicincola oecophyllae]QDH13128.1 hypothetical protein E3E12_01750 [Formicincola oecophyllae]
MEITRKLARMAAASLSAFSLAAVPLCAHAQATTANMAPGLMSNLTTNQLNNASLAVADGVTTATLSVALYAVRSNTPALAKNIAKLVNSTQNRDNVSMKALLKKAGTVRYDGTRDLTAYIGHQMPISVLVQGKHHTVSGLTLSFTAVPGLTMNPACPAPNLPVVVGGVYMKTGLFPAAVEANNTTIPDGAVDKFSGVSFPDAAICVPADGQGSAVLIPQPVKFHNFYQTIVAVVQDRSPTASLAN